MLTCLSPPPPPPRSHTACTREKAKRESAQKDLTTERSKRILARTRTRGATLSAWLGVFSTRWWGSKSLERSPLVLSHRQQLLNRGFTAELKAAAINTSRRFPLKRVSSLAPASTQTQKWFRIETAELTRRC